MSRPATPEIDFAALAAADEELRPYVSVLPGARGHVDFGDMAAVRALTRATLRQHWRLDVQLPPDRLVPRIPNRLAYIKFIETLVAATRPLAGADVHGVDIGLCPSPVADCGLNIAAAIRGIMLI